MKALRRLGVALVAAAWLLSGCKAPRRSTRESAPVADTTGPSFARDELEKHFQKHGDEVGAASKEEYLAKARALVRGGPGVETGAQADGDTVYFREATSELAVVSQKGVLRTYFKPRDGRRYFERQKGR